MALNFLNDGYFAGKVGIGEQSPSAKLQITTPFASSPSDSIFLFTNGSNTPGGGSEIIFGSSTSATPTSYNAKIAGVRSSLDNGSSDLWFQTTHVATATTPTTKMIIKSDGNVGIGTTSPESKLTIKGDPGNTNQPVRITNSVTDAKTGLFINGTGNAPFQKYGMQFGGYNEYSIGGIFGVLDSISGSTSGDITFDMGNGTSSGSLIERMRITHEGNVGIGTYRPNEKLQVGGSIHIWDREGGTDCALYVTQASTATTTAKIHSNGISYLNGGNVGIGTTLPTVNLHVQGSSATDVPIIRSGGFGNSGSKLELAETLVSGNMTYGFSFFNDGNSSNTLKINRHNNSATGTTVITLNRTNNNVSMSGGLSLALKATSSSTLSTDGGTTLTTKNYVDALTPGAGVFLPLAGGTMTGNIDFNDSVRARFGNGDDLQIVHDGSNSYIHNVDVGDLYLRQTADDKDIIFQSDNGSGGTATYLVLDGSSTDAYFSNPGNVGIGHTSPTGKLDVFRTDTNYAVNRGDTLNRAGLLVKSSGSFDSKITFSSGAGSRQYIQALNNAATTGRDISINPYGGNVGIGTTAPGQLLTVNGRALIQNSTTPIYIKVNSGYKSWVHHISSSNSYHFAPSTTNGGETWDWANQMNISTSGVVTANNFVLASDKRSKTKIEDLTGDNVDISWKSFEMKGNEGEYRTGVIAQELEENHPEFVNTDDRGFKSVKYIDLLIAKIAELEARLEILEK